MALTLDGTNGIVSSGSITTQSATGVIFSDSSSLPAASSPFSLKNRIINGDMVIDQRNAGASVALGAGVTAYSADRFRIENNTTGTATAQQVSDAPTGFSNSLKYTVTATDASLASTENAFIQQNIEGFNTADLSFGTASAKTITISFWVKSSLTGTFGGSIINNSYSRLYPYSYTISAANTWEYKTVTISGDTTGTWIGATNSIGVRLMFCLAAASDRVATAGAWTTSLGFGPTGQTNLMATNGATFQITGVQLERNTTATPFEYIPYGMELMLCQRYYQTLPFDTGYISVAATIGTGSARGPLFQLNVNMRAAPTVTLPATGSAAGQLHYTNSSGAVPATIGTNGVLGVQVNSFRIEGDGYNSAFTAGQAVMLRIGTGAGASITASAEL